MIQPSVSCDSFRLSRKLARITFLKHLLYSFSQFLLVLVVAPVRCLILQGLAQRIAHGAIGPTIPFVRKLVEEER